MRLPEINLRELEKIKRENLRERLEFHDWYVKWMKMANNVEWSAAQKAIINRKSEGLAKKTHRARSATHVRITKHRSKN
jgi:hypothetical protein